MKIEEISTNFVQVELLKKKIETNGRFLLLQHRRIITTKDHKKNPLRLFLQMKGQCSMKKEFQYCRASLKRRVEELQYSEEETGRGATPAAAG